MPSTTAPSRPAPVPGQCPPGPPPDMSPWAGRGAYVSFCNICYFLIKWEKVLKLYVKGRRNIQGTSFISSDWENRPKSCENRTQEGRARPVSTLLTRLEQTTYCRSVEYRSKRIKCQKEEDKKELCGKCDKKCETMSLTLDMCGYWHHTKCEGVFVS